MARTVQGNEDVWLLDLIRGGMTRLTFGAAMDGTPVWSPDGMRIAFNSNRTGVYDLYQKPSNGSGADERLVDSPNTKATQDWSPDGRWLVYYDVDPSFGRDLWALDMTGPDHTPRAVANTPALEVLAQFPGTGAGWRIKLTSRAASKSWCSRFPTRAANGRCRPWAAWRRGGAPTAKNSISWRPTRR